MSEFGEDETLKKLRTEEVLRELKEKYGKGKQSGPEESEVSSGFGQILEDLRRKKDEHMARVERYPYTQEVLPKEILNQLFEVGVELREVVLQTYRRLGLPAYKTSRIDMQNPHQRQLAESCLQEMEQVFDRQKIWQSKFSTMPGSGVNDELIVSPRDSLYYVTSQGLSFRLRRVSLYDDGNLLQAVQGISEKIWYEDKDYNKLEQPQLGFRVKDVSSEDLLDQQWKYLKDRVEMKADFQSHIRLHRDGGRLVELSGDDQSNIEAHTGDRINKIYF